MDSPSNETVGQWQFDVADSGEYAVEAFVPATEATSQSATYSVHHAGGVAQRAVNQDQHKGWQSLGHYHFESGVAGSIVLGDATGEDYETLMRKVAFDAVRLSPYVPTPQPDAGIGVDSGGPPPPLDSGAMPPREDAAGVDAQAPAPADAGVDGGPAGRLTRRLSPCLPPTRAASACALSLSPPRVGGMPQSVSP